MNEPLPSPNEPPLLRDGSSSTVSRARWWVHLLLIGPYPLAVGLLANYRSPKNGPALGHGAPGLLLICAIELSVFAAVFGLAWLASRASQEDLFLKWRGMWTIPLGMAYSVGIRLGVGLAIGIVALVLIAFGLTTLPQLQNFFFENRPDVETVVDVAALRDDRVYYWLSLTLVSFVVAGLREELWRASVVGALRRLWPQRLGGTGGQLVAAGIAAIIFGIGHMPQGIIAIGLTSLLGFALGAIIVIHRSIWPAVIAHGLFDATTMAALPWAIELLHKVQHA